MAGTQTQLHTCGEMADEPTVPQTEPEEVTAAVRKKKKLVDPYEKLMFDDEGAETESSLEQQQVESIVAHFAAPYHAQANETSYSYYCFGLLMQFVRVTLMAAEHIEFLLKGTPVAHCFFKTSYSNEWIRVILCFARCLSTMVMLLVIECIGFAWCYSIWHVSARG